MTNKRDGADLEQGGSGTSGQQTERSNDKSLTIAEWTTLAISAAILIGIVGLITWLSFNGEDLPATVVVEVDLDGTRAHESGYYVPITIRNDGDQTVEDAVIQGELDTGSGQPETVDVTIPFLTGGEEVRATFVFRDDPSTGDLTTGVSSYKEP